MEEAAAALGASIPAGQLDAVCEVWEEHWPALRIFSAMRTQWVDGYTGPALNYAALPIVERRLGIGKAEAREAFEHLRVMEIAARAWFAERQ